MLLEDTVTCWAGHQRGGKPSGRHAGVVWQTHGSGKSLLSVYQERPIESDDKLGQSLTNYPIPKLILVIGCLIRWKWIR